MDMVTRMLDNGKTTRRILDYNEQKALQGDAFVVMSRNLPADDPISLYESFAEFEDNPAVDERTRKKGFHMAVNPGPADRITEEGIKGYIQDLMEEFGYADQPYVVYRHQDIDREHYHVVSVRVNRKGKVISDSFSGLKLMEAQKRLASKYGFTPGDASLAAGAEDMMEKPSAFNAKAVNQKQQLVSLFTDALGYDYHSFYQFHCVMKAMNIRATMRRRKDGGYNMVLTGLKGDGTVATRPLSMERQLKVRAAEQYDRRLAENNAMGFIKADRKVRLLAVSDYCREHSRSEAEYCSMLDELGVGHNILRDEKTGDIRRVTLVEKNSVALADTGLSRELFLNAFAAMEKDGRWKKPPQGKAVRAVRRKRIFTPEMLLEMKDLVDRRVAEFRGEKVQPKTGKAIGTEPKLIQNKR